MVQTDCVAGAPMRAASWDLEVRATAGTEPPGLWTAGGTGKTGKTLGVGRRKRGTGNRGTQRCVRCRFLRKHAVFVGHPFSNRLSVHGVNPLQSPLGSRPILVREAREFKVRCLKACSAGCASAVKKGFSGSIHILSTCLGPIRHSLQATRRPGSG